MNEIAMQVMVAVEDASERSSTRARHERARALTRPRDFVVVRARGRPKTSGALAFGNPHHSGLLA